MEVFISNIYSHKKISNCANSCCCSVTKSSLALCKPMYCSTPGFPVLHYLPGLLKLMSVESMMPTRPLLPLLLLPSIFPSIRVFSSELGLCIKWPKYWSFNFSISPSNEYSKLISFKIDWLDLLAVQRSLLQHHNLKTSALRCSGFFMVQLSHP